MATLYRIYRMEILESANVTVALEGTQVNWKNKIAQTHYEIVEATAEAWAAAESAKHPKAILRLDELTVDDNSLYYLENYEIPNSGEAIVSYWAGGHEFATATLALTYQRSIVGTRSYIPA